jgi:uncharacterized membrane protein YeaQ/YmgE (transglycosylase-associated protein family)
VRTYATAAGLPAALVVVVHLALEWNGAGGFAARRTLAFHHGVALVVVLAAVLAASRYAEHLETGAGAPLADAIGIAGTVAVLAHLADVWRDGSNPLYRFTVTAAHIGALLVIAAVTLATARWERARRGDQSGSKHLNPR